MFACSVCSYEFINPIYCQCIPEWGCCVCMQCLFVWVYKSDLLHTRMGVLGFACSVCSYEFIDRIHCMREWGCCVCMQCLFAWVYKSDLLHTRVGVLCLHALFVRMSGGAVFACTVCSYEFINPIYCTPEWGCCVCMHCLFVWVYKSDLLHTRVGVLCLHAVLVRMSL